MAYYVFLETAKQILTQPPQTWEKKVLLLWTDIMTASLVRMMTMMKAVALPNFSLRATQKDN